MNAIDLAERLAIDALAALSGAGISTPAEGYLLAPYLLSGDLAELVKQRDDARAEAATMSSALVNVAEACGATHKLVTSLSAEIERLRAGQHLAEMNVAALESLRERCVTAALACAESDEDSYTMAPAIAEAVRAVPLEVA
jgi:hypothetical protein